jgi:hypothetical protein
MRRQNGAIPSPSDTAFTSKTSSQSYFLCRVLTYILIEAQGRCPLRKLTYLLAYLRTGLSHSREAANCAAIQGNSLPAILRNPKVHHRVHKSPPLVPILRQLDPVHTILSYLSKVHFNIVLPPTSWSLFKMSSVRLNAHLDASHHRRLHPFKDAGVVPDILTAILWRAWRPYCGSSLTYPSVMTGVNGEHLAQHG